MTYSDDHIVLAAEYVLGTLDALERIQVETMMTVDPGFKGLVQAWELKLGVLNEMVTSVEPAPHVWERIKAVVNGLPPPQVVIHPEPPPPAPADETAAPAEPVPPEAAVEATTAVTGTEPEPMVMPRPANTQDAVAVQPPAAPGNAQIIRLSRSVVRWRKLTGLTTAIAAGLAAFLTIESYRPDLLPAPMRRQARLNVVTVQTPPDGQYVALLQRETSYPAFVMTVDMASKTLSVRRVMAQPEQGKSYELWLVSDRYPQPRSLGMIGDADFTILPALASYDADVINTAYYAVTMEPEGGSSTGAATGPVMYTGRLIEAVRPPVKKR
ncbi:MAG: hypothetical protein EPO23_12910 [Xanthobacteraceae bacterium]|nr:MAG: hypothetical protein EPO23_12910 [Xanthobacteraceae bacterium]